MLASVLLSACAFADILPQGGPAPWGPVEEAYGKDGLSYDDGSLSIRIEKDVVGVTNVYYVYITISDISQLRTALAGKFPSKTTRPVSFMADKNNAVIAFNGDFFNYHNKGIVVRSGEILREKPESTRDTLVIDDNGDMIILTGNTMAEWNEYKENGTGYREAFCFGPGLIINGEVQNFVPGKKVSCGAPTPAQRIVMCQLDHLQYMFFICEGPEQNKKGGLRMSEVVDLLVAKGVRQAYNLDGGNSSTLYFRGERMNAGNYETRPVCDSIYFATLVEHE